MEPGLHTDKDAIQGLIESDSSLINRTSEDY
jgi:hypothetical protein